MQSFEIVWIDSSGKTVLCRPKKLELVPFRDNLRILCGWGCLPLASFSCILLFIGGSVSAGLRSSSCVVRLGSVLFGVIGLVVWWKKSVSRPVSSIPCSEKSAPASSALSDNLNPIVRFITYGINLDIVSDNEKSRWKCSVSLKTCIGSDICPRVRKAPKSEKWLTRLFIFSTFRFPSCFDSYCLFDALG